MPNNFSDRINKQYCCPSCRGENIKQSRLNVSEKILAPLLSVVAYRCGDCDKSFYLPSPYTWGRAAALAILVILPFLGHYICMSAADMMWTGTSHGDGNTAPSQKSKDLQSGVLPSHGGIIEKDVFQGGRNPSPSVIRFGKHRKYRVNWVETPSGLTITNLRSGPLRAAGLQVGDSIVTIDGEVATDRAMLAARDRIVSGRLVGVIVDIKQGDETIPFLLLK